MSGAVSSSARRALADHRAAAASGCCDPVSQGCNAPPRWQLKLLQSEGICAGTVAEAPPSSPSLPVSLCAGVFRGTTASSRPVASRLSACKAGQHSVRARSRHNVHTSAPQWDTLPVLRRTAYFAKRTAGSKFTYIHIVCVAAAAVAAQAMEFRRGGAPCTAGGSILPRNSGVPIRRHMPAVPAGCAEATRAAG